MKKFIAILIILAVSPALFAISDGGTQSPFAFGVGAEELALGGANLTSVSPSTAMFWNSSRLASAEQFEFSGFHSRLFDKDVSYQFIGLAYPMVDYGTFGIGVSRLGINAIDRRDEFNSAQDYFDDSRLGVYLAYGKISNNYTFGLSLNIEQHSLDSYKSTSSPGFSLSAGKKMTMNSSLFREVNIALQMNNLLKPSIKLASESVKYPSQIDLGLAANINLPESWSSDLALYSKFYKVDNLSMQYSMGLELLILRNLAIRTGLRESKYSFGFGVNYKALSIDYALIDRDLGSLHMFSVTTAFGKTISERREQRVAEEQTRFNTLMSDRLKEKNNNMIKELTRQGEENLADNLLYDAASNYERVLFLLKSNAQDTSKVISIITDIRNNITKLESDQKFNEYLDSAKTKLMVDQIVEAKYYSTLALDIDNSSLEAKKISDSSDYILNKRLSDQKLFDEQLWLADSLISYGNIAAAERILNELSKIAPYEKGIQRLLTKVSFESYKKQAETAMENDQLESARAALIRAEKLYPGHQWCLEFANLLEDLTNEPIPVKENVTNKVAKTTVTDNMRQEVKSLYASAQTSFENGDLDNAIINWEKVDAIIPNYQLVRTYLINAYKYVGVEYYGKNQLRKAVQVWKKAQALDPKNEEIDTYIKRTINEISKMEELTYGEK